MKYIFILIIGAIISTSICSQSCITDSLVIRSQEQLDDFLLQYPDCDSILGNVIIEQKHWTNPEWSKISNITALQNIKYIGGDLKIHFNSDLESIEGLNNLEKIQGSLYLGRISVPDILPLSSLNSIGNDLTLEYFKNLTNFNGLEGIDTIHGTLTVFANKKLVNLNGLSDLQYIKSDLFITSNKAMSSMDGVNNLNLVGGSMRLNFMDSLISLNGLENLDSIRGYFHISLKAINSFEGMSSLKSIGKELLVSRTNKIKSFKGLDNLTHIGSDLIIKNNYELENLDHLEGLETVGSHLHIVDNYSLINIDGLTNLKSIKGALFVRNNHSLKNLNGIANIDAYTIDDSHFVDLQINKNPNLSKCSVKSICDKLHTSINETTIYENASGCNTNNEIVYKCYNGTQDADKSLGLVVYPVPFNDILNIELPETIIKEHNLKIVDIMGNTVYKYVNKGEKKHVKINIGGLSKGYYLLYISDNLGHYAYKKIMKL